MAESIVFIFKPECFTLLLSSPKNVMYVLNADNLYTPFFFWKSFMRMPWQAHEYEGARQQDVLVPGHPR